MLHTELWEQIFILVRSPYFSVAVLSAQLSESAATEKELVDFFSIHFIRSLSLSLCFLSNFCVFFLLRLLFASPPKESKDGEDNNETKKLVQ